MLTFLSNAYTNNLDSATKPEKSTKKVRETLTSFQTSAKIQ